MLTINKATFAALFQSVQSNRELIWQLSQREIAGRYRGSSLGLLWSFVNPVVMLLVYTFVFNVVLNGRWPEGTGSRTEFSLIIFTGLTVFSIFSEMMNRSP